MRSLPWGQTHPFLRNAVALTRAGGLMRRNPELHCIDSSVLGGQSRVDAHRPSDGQRAASARGAC
eukprot:6230034-Pyramimonas_sp.AAC.1